MTANILILVYLNADYAANKVAATSCGRAFVLVLSLGVIYAFSVGSKNK